MNDVSIIAASRSGLQRTNRSSAQLSKSLTYDSGEFQVYDLSQPLFEGIPVHPADPPFLCTLYRHHSATRKYFKKGFAYSLELIITSMHSGTHMDAPCHMSRHGKLFGGADAEALMSKSKFGFSDLGIDKYKLEVKRGILLDAPKSKKLDSLKESYAITKLDLEKTLAIERIEMKPGDAVLIRTGYGKFFESSPSKYVHGHPGLSAESGRWLADMGASIIGIDNLSLDSTPTESYDAHAETLIKRGIYTIKNMFLEELSEDQRFEFRFFVSPLKLLGGTGSLVRPVGLVFNAR